ncbi:MAG: hypothetical protein QOK71_11595 [Nitrososphaeraceae archaeon]|nr:hypothetical protein [Nitrososphaeraceae archaeon]
MRLKIFDSIRFINRNFDSISISSKIESNRIVRSFTADELGNDKGDDEDDDENNNDQEPIDFNLNEEVIVK